MGIGAPKAGTSWLYGYLRDHSQIFMSPIKEMHVFDAWFRPEQTRYWDDRLAAAGASFAKKVASPPTSRQKLLLAAYRARAVMSEDIAGYMAYFRREVRDEHRAFGELTPNYSLIRQAGFAALRRQHPSVRLIYLLRDPVERLWSGLRMRQRDNDEYRAETGFIEALRDEPMIERSRYDLTLKTVWSEFPRDDVWIGYYETLFDPISIRSLCEWIGVDYVPADFARHPNRSPDVTMSPEQRSIARAMLDPVYRFCRDEFGSGLPAAWDA